MSQSWLGWRCVLGLDLFQFLAELVLPHVIELAQPIDLAQRELALAQISQPRLAVVLRPILVGLGRALV